MHGGRQRRLRITIIMSAVIAMAVLFHDTFQQTSHSAQPTAPPPVPVVTATAKLGDQPVYLTGLGSVVAVNTVTLRSRVDGELEAFAIGEGQMVRSGDLIAQIDTRPFEVQLSQSEAQKERDEAFLANAKVISTGTKFCTRRTRLRNSNSTRNLRRCGNTKPLLRLIRRQSITPGYNYLMHG
jgi:multidrug efflux pump subunit AcrA (membrane-fusion protein)